MVKFDWWDLAERPFDLDALVAESRRPYRHTRETIERMKRLKREKRLAKRQAAWERRRAMLRMTARRPYHARGWIVYALYGALEPGKWYALPDLRNLTGLNYGTIKGCVITMRRRGLLQRVESPDWRVVVPPVPRYLWSLSPAGEAAREAWIAAGRPESYAYRRD